MTGDQIGTTEIVPESTKVESLLEEVLVGAVDLYVHAAPDLMPRRADDVGLAREMYDSPLRAAVHRHHFAATADRARLATEVTGFEMFGSIILNSAVGGINPAAVEVALRLGAVLVSMPTTSAQYMHTRDSWVVGIEERLGLHARHDTFTVWNGDNALHPNVIETIGLVAEFGAILALGYISPEECVAVARAAAAAGIERIFLTNPIFAMGLDTQTVREIMEVPGTILEITAFALQPAHLGGSSDMDNVLVLAGESDVQLPPPDPGVPSTQAELIRTVGIERSVLSSDGGHAGGPSPADELLWACGVLVDQGFSISEIRTLVHDNPLGALGLAT